MAVMIYHDLSISLQCCVVVWIAVKGFYVMIVNFLNCPKTWSWIICAEIALFTDKLCLRLLGKKFNVPLPLYYRYIIFKGEYFLGKILGVRLKKSILLQNSFLNHTSIYLFLNANISIIGPLYQNTAEMVDVNICLGYSATFTSVPSSCFCCC